MLRHFKICWVFSITPFRLGRRRLPIKLAMWDGQPCVVHHVGGLKDTVQDGTTGFSFSGADQLAQADSFVDAARRALDLLRTDPTHYQRIREAAFQQRFLWSDSVEAYIN